MTEVSMTETELRAAMKKYDQTLPSDDLLRAWASATKKDVAAIKAIYKDVTGDPDPWGLPEPRFDDHHN